MTPENRPDVGVQSTLSFADQRRCTTGGVHGRVPVDSSAFCDGLFGLIRHLILARSFRSNQSLIGNSQQAIKVVGVP